jgi:cytochrome c oxidase subunit IV
LLLPRSVPAVVVDTVIVARLFPATAWTDPFPCALSLRNPDHPFTLAVSRALIYLPGPHHERRKNQHLTASRLWRTNLVVWAALLALLLLSLAVAYVPMGRITTAAGIIIAAVKSTLVVVLFMELRTSKPLIQIAVISGLVFLVAMFALILADVLARP